MTAASIHTSSNPGTAHPPLPRQPSMHEWLERKRKPSIWRRVFGGAGIAMKWEKHRTKSA